MKHLKTWEQLNELHSDTYKSASDKMKNIRGEDDLLSKDFYDMYKKRLREETGEPDPRDVYQKNSIRDRKRYKEMVKENPDIVKLIPSWRELGHFFTEFNLLHQIASGRGSTEKVKLILSDPSIDPSNNNNEPLRRTVDFGTGADSRLEKAKVLLKDPRVDPSVAMSSAAEGGHTRIIKEFLKDPRTTPESKSKALASASWRHLDIIKDLLKDPETDPSDDDNYAIRTAVQGGDQRIVRELLKDPRVDPSAKDNYAIISGSIQGRYEAVRELLKDPRVDPSARDNEAYKRSIENGHHSIASLLKRDPRFRK